MTDSERVRNPGSLINKASDYGQLGEIQGNRHIQDHMKETQESSSKHLDTDSMKTY